VVYGPLSFMSERIACLNAVRLSCHRLVKSIWCHLPQRLYGHKPLVGDVCSVVPPTYRLRACRVSPLYKHLFPPRYAPSLSFVGLPWKIVPFPLYELQSRWVARLLAGRVQLPLVDVMEVRQPWPCDDTRQPHLPLPTFVWCQCSILRSFGLFAGNAHDPSPNPDSSCH